MIIDGIRDFVYDINSPSESTKIITLLMQWTDERQIHIHAILHQNKGDENTRGHIGTELNNKAETVLLVEKAPPNAMSHLDAEMQTDDCSGCLEEIHLQPRLRF